MKCPATPRLWALYAPSKPFCSLCTTQESVFATLNARFHIRCTSKAPCTGAGAAAPRFGPQGSPRPQRRRPHLLLPPAPRCVVMHAELTSPLSSLLRIVIYLFACLFIYFRPLPFRGGRAGPAPLGRLQTCVRRGGLGEINQNRGESTSIRERRGGGEGGGRTPRSRFSPLPPPPHGAAVGCAGAQRGSTQE